MCNQTSNSTYNNLKDMIFAFNVLYNQQKQRLHCSYLSNFHLTARKENSIKNNRQTKAGLQRKRQRRHIVGQVDIVYKRLQQPQFALFAIAPFFHAVHLSIWGTSLTLSSHRLFFPLALSQTYAPAEQDAHHRIQPLSFWEQLGFIPATQTLVVNIHLWTCCS